MKVAIKSRLKKKNKTQKWLAERLGISQKHMSQIVNEKVGLTFKMCKKLSVVLGGSVSFWFKLECERVKIMYDKGEKKIFCI